MLRHIIQSRWLTAGLAVLIALITIALAQIFPHLSALDRQSKVVEENLKTLAERQTELEHDAAYMQSDAYLERQARLTLNMKKPGEKVVFVYPNPYNVPSQNKTETSAATASTSWLDTLRAAVSKIFTRD